MRLFAFLILISLAVGAQAEQRDSDKYDSHKVMGNINVQKGGMAGDVRSVNGDIRLENDSAVKNAATFNGKISISNNVKASDLSTVNGSIRSGEDLTVERNVSTVNGSIYIKAGAEIGDSVSTVNGSIDLAKTVVGGNLETLNGDIKLRHSVIAGDIVFRALSAFSLRPSNPRLVIDADSEVRGRIILRQRVELEIEEGAKIGEIIDES